MDRYDRQMFGRIIAPFTRRSGAPLPRFVARFAGRTAIVHGGLSPGWVEELLKENGFTTFGVSSNHILTAELGFARGFDYFRYVNWMAADFINKVVYSWEDAIKKSNRFFLWVHYIDPHSPYKPRSPWIEHYTSGNLIDIDAISRKHSELLVPELNKRPELLPKVTALYDSEINYVDAYIGELIERFELDKNTLFIITSDHGEQLMERGSLGHSIDLQPRRGGSKVLRRGPPRSDRRRAPLLLRGGSVIQKIA